MKRPRHAPYSLGAGSKREHRLACTLQEMETVRLRCDPTASRLRTRVPCHSDIELLVRCRLPFHEPEFPAAWMVRCWCHVACVPGGDHPLSDAEAEVRHSQPTAELVDGAR
jgi:hypothetical protein